MFSVDSLTAHAAHDKENAIPLETVSLISVESSILQSYQEKDGFVYILGWVAFKLKNSHPDLGNKTAQVSQSLNSTHMPPFLANLSYGGLMVPSEVFQIMGKAMEKIFILCHGTSGFDFKRNVVTDVARRISEKYPNFDPTVVKRYIKIRTIARMRFCNLKAQGLLPTLNGAPENSNRKRKSVIAKEAVVKKTRLDGEADSRPTQTSQHSYSHPSQKNRSIVKSNMVKKYLKLSSK